jgi:hypothetical protein
MSTATDGRTGRGRQRHGKRVPTDGGAELVLGNRQSQQCDAQRHDGGTPEPLKETGRDEPRQGWGQCTQRGRCREHRNAHHEDTAIAQAFAECGTGKQTHHQGRLVGGDDPD